MISICAVVLITPFVTGASNTGSIQETFHATISPLETAKATTVMSIEGRGSTDASKAATAGMGEDVPAVAALLAVSEDEAATTIAAQFAFEEALDQVSATSPALVVDAGFASVHHTEAWIVTEGPIGKTAVAELEQLPFDTTVTQVAEGSAARLENLAASAIAAVAPHTAVDHARTRVDVGARMVYVTVGMRADAAQTASAVRDAGSSVIESIAALLVDEPTLGVDVTVATTSTAGPEATVRGGIKMRHLDGDGFCTSGFSVVHGSEYGVITAGHCSNALRFGGATGVVSFVSQFPFDVGGNRIDAQYHRTLAGNSTVGNIYIGGTSAYRSITGTGLATDNSVMCKYGVTTGYGCATVTDAGPGNCVYYNSTGYTHCNLVTVGSHITDDGDSGGPWFLGGTAYGLHSGGSDTSDESWFTKIRTVLTGFGVVIVTS